MESSISIVHGAYEKGHSVYAVLLNICAIFAKLLLTPWLLSARLTDANVSYARSPFY